MTSRRANIAHVPDERSSGAASITASHSSETGFLRHLSSSDAQRDNVSITLEHGPLPAKLYQNTGKLTVESMSWEDLEPRSRPLARIVE